MTAFTKKTADEIILGAFKIAPDQLRLEREEKSLIFTSLSADDRAVQFEFDEAEFDEEIAELKSFENFIAKGSDYIHIVLVDNNGYFSNTDAEITLIGEFKGVIRKKYYNSLIATNLSNLLKSTLKNLTPESFFTQIMNDFDGPVKIGELLDAKFIFLEIKSNAELQDFSQIGNDLVAKIVNSILLELSFKNNIKFSLALDLYQAPNIDVKVCKELNWIDGLDTEPVRYFLSGEMQEYPHIKYLDYYHVLEYYFLESNIKEFNNKVNDLIALKLMQLKKRSDSEVWNAYANLYRIYGRTDKINESDQIQLVLRDLLGFSSIKEIFENGNITLTQIQKPILQNEKTRLDINSFTTNNGTKLKEGLSETERQTICERIALRIYAIRNFIVHTKRGEMENVFVPVSSYFSQLQEDINLLRYLAYSLIIKMRLR